MMTENFETEKKTKASLSSKRGWAFRFVALIVGLLLLVILEGILKLGDWGTPDPSEDPFVGFASVKPLFAVNEAGTHYTIAPSRRDWFYPVEFPVKKASNTLRVFCIGGSTVAGRPYTVETAFSSWLELFLNELDSEREWEVINCGGVSYATYRLVPIVEEVLARYQPDLLVLYTGHNEFLEDRTYEHIKNLPAAVTKPYELASHLRIFNLMRDAYHRITGRAQASVMEARPIMPDEVDALLEHKGGMEHYYRDEEWHGNVIDHFEFNLDRMCAQTAKAGVPMIVMNPSANLRDVRPFKSQHSDDLTESEREEVVMLLDKASEAFTQTQTERAIILYEDALEIDPLYADTHYYLGKLFDLMNQIGPAYAEYVRAKDLDVCPLRMLESMHEVLKEVVDRQEVIWLDTRYEVDKVATNGIPGNNEFLDHVHPNIGGHQFFAKLLVDKLAALGFVSAEPGWHMKMGPVVEEHIKTLSPEYFADGEMRLENLRHWARGLSELEPPVESKRQKPSPEDAPVSEP